MTTASTRHCLETLRPASWPVRSRVSTSLADTSRQCAASATVSVVRPIFSWRTNWSGSTANVWAGRRTGADQQLEPHAADGLLGPYSAAKHAMTVVQLPYLGRIWAKSVTRTVAATVRCAGAGVVPITCTWLQILAESSRAGARRFSLGRGRSASSLLDQLQTGSRWERRAGWMRPCA
jgi:hypothetical protein